jgi:excisionase family DNA binding protein
MHMTLLTTNDAAKVLGCAPDTVRLYERTGKLPAQRTRSGQRLFQEKEVEAFARVRKSSQNGGQR